MFFLTTTPAFAGSGNNSTEDWIVGLLLLAFLFLVYKTILFVVRKLGLKLPTNVITHGSPIVVLLGAFFVLSLGNGLIDIAIALKSLSNINTYLPFFGSDVQSAAQIAIEYGLIPSQFNTSPEIEELLGSCGLAKILSNVVFIVVLAFAAVQIYGVRKVGKVKRDTLLNLQIIGSAIVILAVLFDFYVLNEVLDVILPLRDKNNASFLVIFAIGFVIAFHVFRSYSEKTAEIFGITVEEQPQTEEATTTEAESEQEQGQDKESWFEKNRNVFVGGLAGLIVLILAIILFKNCGGNQTPVQDIVCTDSLDTAESEIDSDYDEESLDVANEGGIDWESYFKKAINDEEFDLYRTPEIKDYIIENYSQAYYDKMIDYAQIGSRPEYNEEERRYEYEIGQQHYVPYNYSALYFYPETGSVEVCLYEDGIICMKNGQKGLGELQE